MKSIFQLLSLVLILAACNKKSKSDLPTNLNLPKDFLTFYDQFHADTAYQVRHITFPLKGMPMHADSMTLLEDNFYYDKALWIPHKTMTLNDTFYSRQFLKLSDEMLSERIIQKDVNYGMERRFAKLHGEWNLIYYMAMNPLAKR